MTKDDIIKMALEAGFGNYTYEAQSMFERFYNLVAAAELAQPVQPEQEPVAFPSRRAVERAIESVENPKGMHLNDGKERVILPGGTLRYMLALIDRASPPQRQPMTHEQRLDLLIEFVPSKSSWNAESILIDMVEAAHNSKEIK